MENQKNKIGLNSFALKIIAITSMLIDHVGAVFFPQVMILRIIGRMAFPIYAYLLVEGFIYTHDIKNYMLRLGIFALISEVPFDLVFFGKPLFLLHQNVFFTLFLGIVVLYFYSKAPNAVQRIVIVFVGLLVSEMLRTDYSSMGIVMILIFYLMRENSIIKILAVAFVNIFLMGYIQVFAVFGLIPVWLHNGNEGRKMKAVFYGFYPVHLLVLYLISLIV